jgi:hypothetical protein
MKDITRVEVISANQGYKIISDIQINKGGFLRMRK